MTNKLREKIKEEFDDVLFQGQVDVYHVDNIIALIVQEKKALLSKIKEYLLTMKQPLISQASYSTVDGRCAYCGDISGEQYNQAIDDIGEKLADILIKQEKAPSITDEKI